MQKKYDVENTIAAVQTVSLPASKDIDDGQKRNG